MLMQIFKYTYIHVCVGDSLATKTISITEEAYERLAAAKDENESFSEVINKITRKGSLTEFAGVLSGKSAKSLEENIKKSRAKSRTRAALTEGMLKK